MRWFISIALHNFRLFPRRLVSNHFVISANTPYLPATKSTGDFALPFDLSYELDVWGRVRRTVSASREEAQAIAGDLATVNLSLHAELAYDYFELRSADAQKKLLDGTVKTYQDALQLTVNRFEGGAAPKSDVAQAQTQLQTTMVQDTDVAVQRAQFEHAIAILVGKPPAAFSLPASPLNLAPPDMEGAYVYVNGRTRKRVDTATAIQGKRPGSFRLPTK